MTDLDDGGRLPPHDIGAERAVLGAAMLPGDALAVAAAMLAPGDFYRPAHQIAFGTMLAMREHGKPVDAVTVMAELTRRGEISRAGGADYLHTLLAAVTTVAHTESHAQIVAELARRRWYIEQFTRGVHLAYSPGADMAALADLAGQLTESTAPIRGRDLAVVDLEPAAEDTPLPVLICGDRLYRGAVHTLSGPPDCGKTTLACWWMLQAVREEGSVLFLDEEGGREIVTEKFQALGAKHGERIGYVEFPSRTWTAEDVAALGAVLDERRPAVVAWDSSAAFLARAGLDENAAADVTRFYSQVLTMAARQYDAAVLVIDHDTKGSEPSRYARGSGAKLAATDVAYKISPIRPFSKTESGSSRLLVTKDRRGWLERDHEAAFLAGGVLTVSISARTGDVTGEPEMAPADRKVLEALTDEPSTLREITDRIAAKHGHGLMRETVSRALGRFAEEGLADRLDQGNGKAALWNRCRSDL